MTAIRRYEGIMHAAAGFNICDDLMTVHVNDLNQRLSNNGDIDFSGSHACGEIMGAVGQLNAMLNLKCSGIDDVNGLLVLVGKIIKSAVGVDRCAMVVGQIRDVAHLLHGIRIKHKNVGAGGVGLENSRGAIGHWAGNRVGIIGLCYRRETVQAGDHKAG